MLKCEGYFFFLCMRLWTLCIQVTIFRHCCCVYNMCLGGSASVWHISAVYLQYLVYWSWLRMVKMPTPWGDYLFIPQHEVLCSCHASHIEWQLRSQNWGASWSGALRLLRQSAEKRLQGECRGTSLCLVVTKQSLEKEIIIYLLLFMKLEAFISFGQTFIKFLLSKKILFTVQF